MYDIIIVGAGSAGLTSAIYAKRANKSVLIFDGNGYGGQIINTVDIENYPATPHISGFDLATKMYNQAKDLGAIFKFEKVEKIEDLGEYKQVITSKGIYEARAIILSTGSKNKKLGLQNEDDLIGKGVGYCATCDGAFYKGKDVAIVGGGNSAFEEAKYLCDVASKVYVIVRSDKFRGDEGTLNYLKQKSNIEFIMNTQVTKLNFADKLESVELTNKDGEKSTLNISGLFVAIGRVPENSSYSHLVKLDEYGYIDADEKCHTNVEGIFVAGDNRKKEVRQIVTATSDGAIAVKEALKYLNKFN